MFIGCSSGWACAETILYGDESMIVNRSSVFPWILGLTAFVALLTGPASSLTAALCSNLAYGALVRGDPRDAERWFDLATRVDSDSVSAWHGLGQAAAGQGNMELALLAYDRALRLQPDDLWARLDRADVRLLLGDEDGASSDWESTDSVDALLWLGHQAQIDEDVELARLFYQLAVQVAPQEWQGYYYLGAELRHQRLFDDAEQVLLAGLDVSPDNDSILLRLGQTQCALQHYEEALRSLSRYIELRPDDFRGWYWRGLCWEETGAMDQALHDFQQAIILNPDDPNLQMAIARVPEHTYEQ